MDGRTNQSRWRLAIYLSFSCVSGFGCMSFNLGNSTIEKPTNHIDQTGVLRQHGEVPVFITADRRVEVYYPRPYNSRPNLKLGREPYSLTMHDFDIIEQTKDHFTIKIKDGISFTGERMISWQADGVPAPLTVDATMQSNPVVPTGGQQ